jgi:TRAP-type C4-dicarboxylate transport system substrate-binding protein
MKGMSLQSKGGPMERHCARITVSVVGVLLLCFFASSMVHAQEAIKMRFSSWWAPSHRLAVVEAEWIKEVDKRTGGKVKISHFTGNTLAPPAQAFDSLSKGLFDIGTSPLSYTAGRFPLMEILDFPLRYRDGVQSTGLANAFCRKFQPKETENVHMLLIHSSGPSFIHTKKKISKLQDVKDLRLKSSGISSKIIEALGGVPVAM